jgi:succinyl-diaminopimelate desuccinylase
MKIDPLEFTNQLIKIPSITPIDAGALDLLQSKLIELGFVCHRFRFEDVDNLYARYGDKSPNLCFAGHTDVVPTGDLSKWENPPFEPTQKDGNLYGRGTADMKSAIAAFVSACANYLENNTLDGSISFLITGDEEGVAINGTKKLLEAITNMGEKIDHCIVGEPTCPHILGDMIKNGRRGSINCTINVSGKQGHVAYPDKADNPIPALLEFLHIVQNYQLDNGADGFQPSNLEIVTIDVGNPATNIIPQAASARFNIRFNTNHSGQSLKLWIENIKHELSQKYSAHISTNIIISGEPFFTPPCHFTDIVQDAAFEITNHRPFLSTTGGTSDARFIKDYCSVIEFGIVGATLHQINEHVKIDDIYKLAQIYERIIEKYFVY